jgi:hypothetical protein
MLTECRDNRAHTKHNPLCHPLEAFDYYVVVSLRLILLSCILPGLNLFNPTAHEKSF